MHAAMRQAVTASCACNRIHCSNDTEQFACLRLVSVVVSPSPVTDSRTAEPAVKFFADNFLNYCY